MNSRKLAILGSTGSIGRNTLAVAKRFPERFSIRALTAKNNIDLLAAQVQHFCPEVAVVYDPADAGELKKKLGRQVSTKILHGEQGYLDAATHEGVDMVVSAMVGAAGLLPTLAAIEAKKDIALANKETLVMAGDLVMDKARTCGVRVLPVDSEHSAIFQCICGNRPKDVEKILLTASGGPFCNSPASEFARVKPDDALAHPTWQMGSKITIDSATLMNKGLEVIEAMHLFSLRVDQVEVVIHPQSIIHSMVAYCDGTVMAQMGLPDMQGAIAYALSYPQRLPLGLSSPDFPGIGKLTFQAPDLEKFACLALALEAGKTGGTMPAVLNAANEVTVAAFLEDRIGFDRISGLIGAVMQQYEPLMNPDLDTILAADAWGRRAARAQLPE
ncbi:MAG: 1-deoxy-D-xylulose-5-phosphate reductoisomerase [Desulfobacteraceae bacterium]|nr:1-deoxy-D-xylulose-5-phosphate reductoisomerase [Desulfobacteraceae bacterium]